MSTIVTRSGKGSPLTHTEVDNNFTNLNTDKLQSGDTAASLVITSADINGGTIDGTTIGASSASTGAFTTATASTSFGSPVFKATSSAGGALQNSGGTNCLQWGGGGGSNLTLDVNTNVTGAIALNGGTTIGDASGDSFTINSSAVSIPNGLNFDSNTLVIDATNNRVGVGTNSPTTNLHVKGAYVGGTILADTADRYSGITFQNNGTTKLQMYYDNTNVGAEYYLGSGTNYQAFFTNATERMRITSGGDVGIGLTSISGRLDVAGSNSRVRWVLSTSTVNQVASNVDGSAFANAVYDGLLHAWNTSSTERMRLTSAGNLAIGDTATDHKLSVIDPNNRAESAAQMRIGGNGYSAYHFLDATAYYIGQNSNIRSLRMYSGGNPAVGVNLSAGGNSWGTYSDERVKDIIEPIEGGVEKLLHLRTVIGKYKFDETNKRRVFLIAQDVKSVLPEAVSEDPNGSLSLQYQDLIPVLVKAIQEQQAIITNLTTRLTALESK